MRAHVLQYFFFLFLLVHNTDFFRKPTHGLLYQTTFSCGLVLDVLILGKLVAIIQVTAAPGLHKFPHASKRVNVGRNKQNIVVTALLLYSFPKFTKIALFLSPPLLSLIYHFFHSFFLIHYTFLLIIFFHPATFITL